MNSFRTRIARITTARLNRSVVMWVFISVIIIEGIILIPSYENQRKMLLAQLREVTSAKIELLIKEGGWGQADADLMKLFQNFRKYIKRGVWMM